jgi:multicomponent Na+:H+ antiporter subunit B
MTLIVKTVTKITLGFILLYGIYIGLNGNIGPGGGFAGGVIIALSLVHIMLAFGKEVALKRLHSHTLRNILCVAALAFLFAAIGPEKIGRIFDNDIMLPVCEMIVVGAGLFGIFVALVLLSKQDRDSE